MTGGTLAAKQVELLKKSFPDLPWLTVLGDSLSTAQLDVAQNGAEERGAAAPNAMWPSEKPAARASCRDVSGAREGNVGRANGVLNRCCSFDARLELMLLGDPSQNPFSTVSDPQRTSAPLIHCMTVLPPSGPANSVGRGLKSAKLEHPRPAVIERVRRSAMKS